MRQESAQTLALQALEWIAGDDELGPVFMNSTGTSADDMRARAADPDYQLSVLEFLTMDDAWITGFCDARGLPYDAPLTARRVLAGPAEGNWT